MRALLSLATAASLFAFVMQPAGAAAETGYAAVWRPGSGAQWWRAGMTGAEAEAQDQTYFGQGLRMTALAVENGKYAAVWQPGSGAQWWSHSRCLVDLKTEDAAYFGQGLRLGFIKLQDQAA